jgi:hypothetical protein
LAGEVLLVDVIKQSQDGQSLVTFEHVEASSCRISVIGTIPGICSAERTVFAVFAQDNIYCLGIGTVVESRQTALIRALIENFYSLDGIRWKVP